MKKSDLKVGMSFLLRNGRKHKIIKRNGVVLGECFVGKYTYQHFLCDIKGDLTCEDFKEADIIKVYDENGKLIWERKQND